MDIKTRLEEDTVLGVSLETKKFLNSKGIYTIEEFINLNESDLPVTRGNYYLAMQHIFRHSYLGQELIYDVILEKEYNFDKKGFEDFSKDYIKLGLVNKGCSFRGLSRNMEDWEKRYKEMLNTDTFSMKMILERLYEQNENHKAIQALHDLYISRKISFDELDEKEKEYKNKVFYAPDLELRHSNILRYYKQYIDVKKEQKEKNENDTYTLMYLKEQISQLINQRDNLDKQIEVLQNRVSEILGENKSNGK